MFMKVNCFFYSLSAGGAIGPVLSLVPMNLIQVDWLLFLLEI